MRIEQLTEGWVVREYNPAIQRQYNGLDKDYLMAELLGFRSAGVYGLYYQKHFNGFFSSLNYLHFHTKADAERAKEHMEGLYVANKLAKTNNS